MVEARNYDDEELLRLGRDALKLQRYAQAREFLAEYCDRQTKRGGAVPAGILASYSLSLGHTRSLKEALDFCLKALASDRRNAYIYWSLAQLYILADSRKKAIDVVEAGLRMTPDHMGLLKLREELGVRQEPPIKFLSRKNTVNVRLGKAIHKLKSGPRKAGSRS